MCVRDTLNNMMMNMQTIGSKFNPHGVSYYSILCKTKLNRGNIYIQGAEAKYGIIFKSFFLV